jgi:DNA-binding NarL/FixJ family response regulator
MPNPFEDLGKKKILMIDKTKAILNKLKEKLDTKYEFIHSPDSYKALLLIGSDKPQLVIMDSEVDGLGYENVCKTIKENKELKKIKVVVFGLEQKQITPENLKAIGANKLIKRGAKINSFLSAIEQLIE